MATNQEIERLREIEDEIEELADEAIMIFHRGDENIERRSRAYWFGEIKCALNDESYVPSSYTLREATDDLERDSDDKSGEGEPGRR